MPPGTTLSQRLTLAVACTAQIMLVLDVMIVSVALPSLQHELHLSPSGLEWVVTAYALALATLIPAGGALGDHFGRKRIFMSGLALFTLASAGCALSGSGGVLIGFRVIQGIGGAVMSSLTLALIAEAYPPHARTGPIGLWAAVSGLAVAGGSVAGGLLLSVFPWSDRVRPVQRLPPDRHRDRTGHPGIRRRWRDHGALARPGGRLPAGRGAASGSRRGRRRRRTGERGRQLRRRARAPAGGGLVSPGLRSHSSSRRFDPRLRRSCGLPRPAAP
jgi:hypothetical protein